MESWIDGKFLEAVGYLSTLVGFGGLGVEIEEGRAIGVGVKITKSPNDDRLIIFKLNASIDLVLILIQPLPFILFLLLLANMHQPVTRLLT